MKQLSKECIELIEEQLIKKCYLNHESAFESIVEQCLTNPSILKSANLYTQEEMDKAWEEGFKRGLNQCQEGAILIGEPFRK